MSERLTWEEVQEKYPDQWVAMKDVKFKNNDNINVETAIVVANMTDDEYVDKRLEFVRAGYQYFYFRTEIVGTFCGALSC